MKIEVPNFLIEMSKQMNEQPNRETSHPFWQVRCKRYIVTAEGYDQHHWTLLDDGNEFFRSDKKSLIDVAEYFYDKHNDWFVEQLSEVKDDNFYEGMTDSEIFAESFDFDISEFPYLVNRVFMQETEEVVTTHLTEADAKWFIKRKQHDYPPLYTHVESAYWSPQLRELQDWIIGLKKHEGSE